MKKKNLNFYMGMIFAKAGKILTSILGKRGSSLSGRWAKKVCPDFLSYLEKPKTLVYITGTYGKEAVFDLVGAALKTAGYDAAIPSFETSDEAGIISALLEKINFSGKSLAELAILKVDETCIDSIFSCMKPDICLVTNILRDGQEYKGSKEYIGKLLNQHLSGNERLILNSDDDIIQCFEEKKEKISFSIQKDGKGADYQMSEVDRVSGEMHLRTPDKEEKFPLLGSRRNDLSWEAAGITLLYQLGLNTEQILASIRQEIEERNAKHAENKEMINDKELVMCLVREQGPTDNSRIFEEICEADKECAVIFLNYNGYDDQHSSENMSWLYETRYEFLNHPCVRQILFCGKRCFDYKIRALLAGIPETITECALNSEDVVKLVDLKAVDRIYFIYAGENFSKASEIKGHLKKRIEKEAE